MRRLEKISKNQFEKDFAGDCDYDDIVVPRRSSSNSAGYDFKAVYDFKLNPGEIVKIPTGIKCLMNNNEFLAIYVRSSIGFKYNVRLTNQTGIIDSDYYGNINNEGHIWLSFQNEGTKVWEIKKGDGIAQCIFQKFYTVDDETMNYEERMGGIGSTDN